MKSLLCLLSLLASACVLLWVPVWLSVSIPSAFTELLSDRQSLIHAGCLSQEHRKICWHPAQSLEPWDPELLTQAPIVKPRGHLCTLLERTCETAAPRTPKSKSRRVGEKGLLPSQTSHRPGVLSLASLRFHVGGHGQPPDILASPGPGSLQPQAAPASSERRARLIQLILTLLNPCYFPEHRLHIQSHTGLGLASKKDQAFFKNRDFL